MVEFERVSENIVRIHDKLFVKSIAIEQIRERIKELAEMLDQYYQNQTPEILVIMDGSFVFAAELLRAMRMESRLHFIKISSYSGVIRRELHWHYEPDWSKFNSSYVLIIEDIIDSGETMISILEHLHSIGVHQVDICSLLIKPEILNDRLKPRWVGFRIAPDFVVGYGMDYMGLGRTLEDIYKARD